MPYYKMAGKKDGLQKYRVVVSFTDSAGEHRQLVRTAYGRDAAIITEERLRREAEEAPQRMTVAELVDRYLGVKKQDMRATSWDRLRRNLASQVVSIVGDVRIDKLTPDVLEDWKRRIIDSGNAITTCRNAYRDFGGVLNYAVKVDILHSNPLKRVGNFRDNGEQEERVLHYYTREDFGRYMAVAREDAEASGDWRFYVFFAVAYYTGMRKGEIHALRWSDIDGRTIHVRRSISQKLRSGDAETRPKTRSSIRDIQMPAPLIEALDAHRARQKACRGYTDEWRVVGGEEILRDTSVEKANARYAERAGLPHIRIHDFRHSHASLLCNAGINIQEVARRLGHSNVQITWNIYSHMYPAEEERAVAVLDGVRLV